MDNKLWAKCFHPTGKFVKFKKEGVEQSIPNRFEQMVRIYPDRLAIKIKNRVLTYKELNQAANRVARAILEQRGEGEEPIALLLEHGDGLLDAILGVLKAGKIYVPLNPIYPSPRISSILEDSQAQLIVTDNDNWSLAKEVTSSSCGVININEIDGATSVENPSLDLSPDRLAYILYTSGSTGLPKGLVQNHRNVLHNTMTYTNRLHISPDDRLTLLHSCSYGASINNLFGALLNGGALFPFDIKKEGVAYLGTFMVQEGITIFHSVPAVFRNLKYTITGEENFSKLRVIHLSGAPAINKDVKFYKAHFSPDCIFVHRLGSTEANTVFLYFIDKDSEITGSIVPVGYAVEDKEILMLNDAGEQVGINEVGEIAIKSRYLSPGYWHDPDRTRATFLLDSDGGDKRIYRTGDLGCMLPDGCVKHLGRKDSRVKVRGHRIEIAEIEIELLNLDLIKEAAVLVQEDPSGEKHLVAYIVPGKDPAPTTSELRSSLQSKLPHYMLPRSFVMLDALPLTPNGKLDRRRLPEPNRARPKLEKPFVAPRTPVEKIIGEIWVKVLGLEPIGLHDNFFDLGGHSLLATQIISRVRDAVRVELSQRSLIENPTIEQFASRVTLALAEKTDPKRMMQKRDYLENITDEEVQRLLADKSGGVSESRGNDRS